ncbi:MAG: FapA family protein [Selenomonadaceae bacterium]|nr:FapA family protein [Selenomonadaceae bacterium]
MREKLTLGGPSSGYKYEFTSDGVYLTVYPSVDNERLFELSDMRQILRDCKVLDYDVGILSRTMREANGRPQKIAEAVDITEEDLAAVESGEASADSFIDSYDEDYVKMIVDMPRDKMKAVVRYDTREGAKLPTKEMVLNALKEAGVVYGIDEDAIEVGIRSLSAFTAAEGLAPVPGENAYIDRKFDLGIKGRPVVDEYDKVDYKDLNLFVLAKENQTLAIRIPQTKGTPGKNVLGETVPAQNGRPVPMPEGKNTKAVGERLIATTNGQIVDKGSRISVDPRIEIKGSVGVSTGDIVFDGTVLIKGNVDDGFKVNATGDVEIRGSVNGGEVRGRNVYISGGITGADKAKVYAERDVRTAFIENGLIEAGNDIFISDIALHSQIRAGKRIMMEDKHGQITGGHAVAGELIDVKVIGNDAFVVTKISVGIDPNLQKEYQTLKKVYKESRRRLTHINQTLNTLSKIDINTLPQSRIESINALTRSQFPLAGQIKRDEKRILEIEKMLAEMKNGRVRVSDTIFPGTRLGINSLIKSIQTEYRRCTIFLNESGEVEVGPY